VTHPTSPSFLHTVADTVAAHAHPSDCLVVLPSQRAASRFRKVFADRLEKPEWLPRTCTLGQLLQEHTELVPMDPLEGLAELYLVWKSLKSKDKNEEVASKLGFQSFMHWGKMALRDFNEIDQHLLDANQVFQNLCDIEDIEEWSFDSEENLKPGQLQFLRQYLELGPLYSAFQERLKAQNWGYAGSMAKAAIASPELKPYAHVFVAGLSVLTPAEKTFLGRFEKQSRLTWLWDADASYVDDPLMEAGIFIRKQATKDAIQKLPRRLAESAPKIHIKGCSSSVYQAQAVREIVQSLPAEEQAKTGVILPDGKSLSMLLQSLPSTKHGGYNVTMGLNWSETPAFRFLDCVKRMVIKRGSSWHHLDLRLLIGDHLALAASGRDALLEDGSWVMKGLAKSHMAWVKQEQLEVLSKGTLAQLTGELIPLKLTDPLALLMAMEHWSGQIGHRMEGKDEADPWVMASWQRVMRAISVVRRFQENHPLLASPEEVWAMLDTCLSSERIDLLGEPEQGLQIMGLIETRALDFKRVIVLDCNEGVLPKTAIPESYIPFDLRARWGLPGRHEREAIYAYYTYRLLNRAEEVTFLYRAQDDGSEKSRYLLQIEQAFKPNGIDLLPYEISAIQAPLPGPRPEIPALEWTAEARGRLVQWAQNGISPSAMNTLLACRRNFFYQYMLRLHEPPEIQEEMAVSTFGSIVHQVLEDGLRELKDEPLTSQKLKDLRTKVDQLLPLAIKDNFHSGQVDFGENYLQVTMAEATLKKLLSTEINELDDGLERTIRSLELSLSHTFNVGGPMGSIRLHGKADRIEQEGINVVVTDYKTGAVKPGELSLPKEWEEKVASGKSGKALQLLIYAALALEMLDTTAQAKTDQSLPLSSVRAGIRSGKNARAGLLELKLDKRNDIQSSDVQALLGWIQSTLETLHHDTPNVQHDHDAKYCAYCAILDPIPDYF
jgi:ATP-dependent helicase/nuclease subunit B